MRTLILILILSLPLSLIGQEYITIPTEDAPALKQYKINWHTGIDPVQIKDGTWVLNIEVIDLIPNSIKIVDAMEKQITADLREYLISKPKRILRETDFKVSEMEPVDVKIIR